MPHECHPWVASRHARHRWGERFAGTDFDEAFARASLRWFKDNGDYYLADLQTHAEFVVRRDVQDAGLWVVCTVVHFNPYQLANAARKRRAGRRR